MGGACGARGKRVTAHPRQMTRSLPTGTTHSLAELSVHLSNIHTDKYLRLAPFAVTVAQKSFQLHLKSIKVIALDYKTSNDQF